MYFTDDLSQDFDLWKQKSREGNDTSLTLDPEDDGLLPNTEYDIVIQTRNQRGDSPLSEPKKITTGTGG